MQTRFHLSGRIAVITGASGVLCGALSKGIAAAGVKVALIAHHHPEGATETAEAICQSGGEARVFTADVLDRDALARVRTEVETLWGEVDILVNGAGGAHPDATTSPDHAFFDLPETAVRQVMDLNFLGTFLPCQEFGRGMAERGRGWILNFSSRGAVMPLSRSVGYSAGKAAVSNFTRWLAVHMAQEYSPEIRVNALVPGFFLTRQNRFLLTNPETGEWSERGQRIIQHTPVARFGNSDDLIGPALWLLSDAAEFVHGITLEVDGGMTAWGGV